MNKVTLNVKKISEETTNIFINRLIRFAKDYGLFKILRDRYNSIEDIKTIGSLDLIIIRCLWELYLVLVEDDTSGPEGIIMSRAGASALSLKFLDSIYNEYAITKEISEKLMEVEFYYLDNLFCSEEKYVNKVTEDAKKTIINVFQKYKINKIIEKPNISYLCDFITNFKK